MNELQFRIALLKNNISQNELARRIGVHPMTVSSVVRGHRNAEPTLRRKIASTLNVSEKKLFNDLKKVKNGEAKVCPKPF